MLAPPQGAYLLVGLAVSRRAFGLGEMRNDEKCRVWLRRNARKPPCPIMGPCGAYPLGSGSGVADSFLSNGVVGVSCRPPPPKCLVLGTPLVESQKRRPKTK